MVYLYIANLIKLNTQSQSKYLCIFYGIIRISQYRIISISNSPLIDVIHMHDRIYILL